MALSDILDGTKRMSSRQGQHVVQETSLRHAALHAEHLTNRQRAERHVGRQTNS